MSFSGISLFNQRFLDAACCEELNYFLSVEGPKSPRRLAFQDQKKKQAFRLRLLIRQQITHLTKTMG